MKYIYTLLGIAAVTLLFFFSDFYMEGLKVRQYATFVDRSTAVKLLKHCMAEKGVLTEALHERGGRLVRVQCRAYIYYEDYDEHTEIQL